VGVVACDSGGLAESRGCGEVHQLGATDQKYGDLVAAKDGWASVPPGTRTSLYKNPEYLKAASFAQKTLDSMDSADPTKPTVKPVPYVGIQFALAKAQASSEAAMKKAGYIK
jgi:hypothetical protein